MENEKLENSEKTEEIKTVEPKLNPILENKTFAWLILSVTTLLMLIENFLKIDNFLGGWHIIIYLLLPIPLAYTVWKKETINPYIKWFFPLLVLMIWDMFYYNNNFVQEIVPLAFYFLVITLYLTSMHNIHSFYQTLFLRLEFPWGLRYMQIFFSNLFIKNDDRKIYYRIALALLITLPFLIVFVSLLFSADKNFGDFLTNLVDFDLGFKGKYLVTLPLTFGLYLLLFLYGLSNHKDRTQTTQTKALDMLIVGIFLGMINLLFFMFVSMQMPFLFGSLPEYNNLAEFARQGFFQLMMVMGIVLLIFLFIMRRFKGEKIALFMLGGLLVQTILMGIVSLKKMYLYQSIKGATVMRYYVEWFDYLLLAILILGIIFLVKKLPFAKLLNLVAILGTLSFALVISLNVDGMVASNNIEKFKDKPSYLDKNAIIKLSIDALPQIQGTDIIITKRELRDCSKFSNYHFGYCSKIEKYGDKQYQKYVYQRITRGESNEYR